MTPSFHPRAPRTRPEGPGAERAGRDTGAEPLSSPGFYLRVWKPNYSRTTFFDSSIISFETFDSISINHAVVGMNMVNIREVVELLQQRAFTTPVLNSAKKHLKTAEWKEKSETIVKSRVRLT